MEAHREAQSEALREALQAVGVWPWLREQFPGLSDGELVAAVDGDFESIVGGLQRKAPRVAARGASENIPKYVE